MSLDRGSLQILARALEKLDAGFSFLPRFEPSSANSLNCAAVLLALAEKLADNYPYFHPLYAGQMLKPPHPIARLAYSLAMYINPNNHALDGGRATSAMEKEAVAEIAAMLAGTIFLAICAAAAPWPTWKPCGSPASCTPARPFSRASKPTTPTSAFPAYSNCRSKRFRATR